MSPPPESSAALAHPHLHLQPPLESAHSVGESQRAPAPSPLSPSEGERGRGEGGGILGSIRAYVSIARPDHWCKNVFMALGVVLAIFCHPELFGVGILLPILWGVATTCLVASSNYVLNEILDAPTDRHHPVKRHR